jgi:hypothetical protein
MSATSNSPPTETVDEKGVDTEKYAAHPRDSTSIEYNKAEDILGQQDIDPALNAKMHIVNNVRIQLLWRWLAHSRYVRY